MSDTSLLPSSEADALLRTIGNTPLIPLLRIGGKFPRVRIFAKAEWYNPGGSVKDRPAYRMIRAAELSGQLTPGKTILDATSGNTGIAYAMIAARRGYPCKLLMPANASTERKKLLKAYGAEVVLTDPAEGSDGAFLRGAAPLQGAPRSLLSIPTSTAIPKTRARTTKPRGRRSSSRPTARSPISSPGWAPAAR
jgi:cysteine synthase